MTRISILSFLLASLFVSAVQATTPPEGMQISTYAGKAILAPLWKPNWVKATIDWGDGSTEEVFRYQESFTHEYMTEGSYTVRVFIQDGKDHKVEVSGTIEMNPQSKAGAVDIFQGTSMEDASFSGFLDPVSDQVKVHSSQGREEVRVRDLSGMIIGRILLDDAGNGDFSLVSFPAGVYFLDSDSGKYTRVIKP